MVTLDLCGSAGDEFLFLDTVADNDNFVEDLGIFKKSHIKTVGCDLDFTGGKADVGELQDCTLIDFQGIVSINVGRGSL